MGKGSKGKHSSKKNVFKVSEGRAVKAKQQKLKNCKKMKVKDEAHTKKLNEELDRMQDDVRRQPEIKEPSGKMGVEPISLYSGEKVDQQEMIDCFKLL